MLRIPARNVYPRQARPALYIHNYYGTPTPLSSLLSLSYLLWSQAEAKAAFMILFYL